MKDIFLNSDSPENMPKRFSEWWRNNRGRSIAVFGAGCDFEAICEIESGFQQALLCVIDESGIEGRAAPETAVAMNPDIIICASLIYQERMRRKLRGLGYKGELILLYRNDPEIGALGLLAYDPSRDWPLLSFDLSNRQPKPGSISRILMVAPPFDIANHRHKKTMPLGLLYLGAAIREALPEASIELIDAHIDQTSWHAIRQRIDSSHFDALLVSYWSSQSRNAWMLSDYVRATKAAWVIHGGAHPTMEPVESQKHCDVIIAGEGERKTIAWLRAIRSGGDVCATLRANSTDIDKLPFPAWDLLEDATSYDHPLHVVGGRRFPIIGSRGCPFSCTFCSSPTIWNHEVQRRKPCNVVDEMDEIHRVYGLKKFHFWDDNMIMNREWIAGLCDELIERKRDYQWVGLSRASDIIRNKSLLQRVKKAGCVGIEIGVESFADQVSAMMRKGEFVETTRGAAVELREAGIKPLYTHMLFTPGETIRSYHQKEKFMAQLNSAVNTSVRSDSMLGQLTTPHVNTIFARDAQDMGLILWRNVSDSYHHRINFIPNTLLDDIPVKSKKSPPDPLQFLGVISQSVYDWKESDMRFFIRASALAWPLIDGQLSVRAIAEKVTGLSGCNATTSIACICLAVVYWARTGTIESAASYAN